MNLRTPTLEECLQICRHAREDDQEQYRVFTGSEWDAEYIAELIMEKEGPKWVATDNGHPFVMGGYDHVVNGVYQSWMIGTMIDWQRHWRSITKISRLVMNTMLAADARRLQTCVLASRTETCQWYVRGLKMKLDGLLPGFGVNGETMAMYARVRE